MRASFVNITNTNALQYYLIFPYSHIAKLCSQTQISPAAPGSRQFAGKIQELFLGADISHQLHARGQPVAALPHRHG